jgi:tetratricopeptide (TPR) repeat protein
MSPASLRAALLTAVLVSSILPGVASAFTYVPTEREWAAWTPYCRAKYAKTIIGRKTDYSTRVSQAEIERWNRALGEVAFTHIHHHCMAVSYLNRARLDANEKKRMADLDVALDNSTYAIQRIPISSPVYADVAINHALILDSSGRYGEAQRVLESLVEGKPESSAGYVALGYLYASHGDKKQARAILEKGNLAANGQSADIHYNLGLICAELHDYDCAVSHAKSAYDAGHPLPGLRDKLVAAGKWDSRS